MKKRKFIYGSLIPFISASLANATNIDPAELDLQRVPQIRIKIPKAANNHEDIELDLLKEIETIGIFQDEKSEVYLYEEKGVVNLDCFNCFATSRALNDLMVQSQNDRGPHSGYTANE